MGVLPDGRLNDILDALIAGLGTQTLHLAKNNVMITRSTVLGDFTEADYSGYVSQVIPAFVAAVNDGANHRASAASSVITFQNTTGVAGNSIYAVYATNAAGHLLWAEEVSGGPTTPVDMLTAGKVFLYTPVMYQYSFASTSP